MGSCDGTTFCVSVGKFIRKRYLKYLVHHFYRWRGYTVGMEAIGWSNRLFVLRVVGSIYSRNKYSYGLRIFVPGLGVIPCDMYISFSIKKLSRVFFEQIDFSFSYFFFIFLFLACYTVFPLCFYNIPLRLFK